MSEDSTVNTIKEKQPDVEVDERQGSAKDNAPKTKISQSANSAQFEEGDSAQSECDLDLQQVQNDGADAEGVDATRMQGAASVEGVEGAMSEEGVRSA